MKRIMSFDVGSNTLGLAQSDLLRMMAHPIKTFYYEEANWNKALDDIFSTVSLNEFSQIIIGLPKTLKNKPSESTKRSLRFKDFLQNYINKENKQEITIKMWDERFSTNTANNVLKTSTVNKKNKKKLIDTISAVIILDSYLQFIK